MIPPRKKRVRERTVEGYLVAEGKKIKVKFRKHTGYRGAPDRIGNLGKMRCVYVETKARDGRLSPHQVRVHAELRAEGAKVYVCKTFGDVDQVIALCGLWRRA